MGNGVDGVTVSLDALEAQLAAIESTAERQLTAADTLEALDAWRIEYLGRKGGALTAVTRQVKELPNEDKPKLGALANALQERLTERYEARERDLKRRALEARLAGEKIDVTMPGVYRPKGERHPLTHVMQEMTRIFQGMGFDVLDDNLCPEVETDYYNFDALNFPPDHPAKDMQDTFYTDVAPNVLLRSQTSNAQIRYMEKNKLPIRVVAPGRVYRNEQVTARKHVLFHQMEGLLVDEAVRFSDLKGVLHEFANQFFGATQGGSPESLIKSRPTRFRASYFPFTEPSAEMDVQCILCEGAGCRVCSHKGWLEVLGAGMVDPNVLEGVGIDSERYTGFAFGMGVERLAMLKYAFEDIRQFYQNDMRFLKAFKP